MKKILYFLLFFIQFPVLGQNTTDLMQMADEIYKFGDYKDALDLYKQALEIDSSNAHANLMMGKCYLETAHKEKSLPYLLKVFAIDNHATFNLPYLLASAYQLNYNFEEATNYYNQYKKRLLHERVEDGLNDKDELKKTEHRLKECEYGKTIILKPKRVLLENMSDSVNSEFSDYAPVISGDESVMFFTSRRKGSTGGNKDNDNEFFEDIYFSKKVDGKWSKAENVGTTINTNLHEACIGVSSNGKELFIYKDDDKNTGDIFYCLLDKHNHWSKPKPLNKNINTDYIENSITLSEDGKTLFFSSNRPGGFGGMDIYMSTLDKDGDWNTPVNLGEIINTEYDDESPFYYQKDNALYFSSKGHDGMGGFDLFKSKLDATTKKWSAPENLGFPINSPDDDIYFVLAGNGDYAYYSSVKEHCYGDIDLYKIQLNVTDSVKKEIPQLAEKETSKVKTEMPEIKKSSVMLHLTIAGEDKHPLDAKIRIFDAKTNKVLAEGYASNGEYDFQFKGKNKSELMISAEKDGYVFKTEKILIAPVAGKEDVLNKKIVMSKIAVGYRMVLHNIYFDYDKATLKKESVVELDRLYEFLKANPKVVAVIEGHTDNHGSDAYNVSLSLHRSQTVINYLSQKGISKRRLVAKGYGETKPLASNDDEDEGRELNRRTEFLITRK